MVSSWRDCTLPAVGGSVMTGVSSCPGSVCEVCKGSCSALVVSACSARAVALLRLMAPALKCLFSLPGVFWCGCPDCSSYLKREVNQTKKAGSFD